jgi:hypothetical protein
MLAPKTHPVEADGRVMHRQLTMRARPDRVRQAVQREPRQPQDWISSRRANLGSTC